MKHASTICAAVLLVAGASLPMADTDKIEETGCIFSFTAARTRTMVHSVENVVVARTKSGLSRCRISDKAIARLREVKAPITCGGWR